MKNCISVVAFSHLLLYVSSVSAQSNVSAKDDEYLTNLYNTSILFDTTRVRVKETAAVAVDSMDAWKDWQIVENYSYGKNRGSLPMIADLEALHPYFRDKVQQLIRMCTDAGITLAIVESYRTHAKQSEYYAMGRKYTSSPGGK